MKDGLASGEVINWEPLVEQVKRYEFDALGIATPIRMSATEANTETMPTLIPPSTVVAGPVSDWWAIFFTGA